MECLIGMLNLLIPFIYTFLYLSSFLTLKICVAVHLQNIQATIFKFGSVMDNEFLYRGTEN